MSRDLALGRLPAGTMNKTEAAYAAHLDALKAAGEIRDYRFEGVTLKIAPDTRYTADFLVFAADRCLELHEVKGFWRDDAFVKIKVAADRFPFFAFKVVKALPKKAGGGFDVSEVGK